MQLAAEGSWRRVVEADRRVAGQQRTRKSIQEQQRTKKGPAGPSGDQQDGTGGRRDGEYGVGKLATVGLTTRPPYWAMVLLYVRQDAPAWLILVLCLCCAR